MIRSYPILRRTQTTLNGCWLAVIKRNNAGVTFHIGPEDNGGWSLGVGICLGDDAGIYWMRRIGWGPDPEQPLRPWPTRVVRSHPGHWNDGDRTYAWLGFFVGVLG